MKKIILSESQTQNLVTKFLNEQLPAPRETGYSVNDGRYRMKCEFYFQYNNDFHRFKNGEIDDISHGIGEVSFLIDTQEESYGIKGITIRDIRGPNEIKGKIRYYPEGSSSNDENWWEKRREEEIVIPLNWRKVKIDDSGYKMNYIGVGKRIDVDLEPDGNGGLKGGNIEVTVKVFTSEED